MKLIECPRDAMQGIIDFIPTQKKVEYINKLLRVGFHTIDFGSFVSSKVVPQMKDTNLVLSQLDIEESSSKLLAIVANVRGAQDAASFEKITYLGYPFSVSEKFQLRNTNKTIDQSLVVVEEIQNICSKTNKKLVIYLSMAFGNPYNESWDIDLVLKWAEKIANLGVEIVALSDTIGVSDPKKIHQLFRNVSSHFESIEWGLHLHTTSFTWREKVKAAYEAGCRRYDGALKGYGGCPMAEDKLIGNMPTEKLVSFFEKQKEVLKIDKTSLKKALITSNLIFD